MGEIDERHLILQEELVAHVHDLVKRIDLVLAESERGRLGLEFALCRTCATRLRAARGARSRADEDGPRLRRPGAVHHGRRRDPGLRAARRTWSAAGFRVDVANVPFKWYPVSELVRQALAWRLLDVTESNGTPVDLVIPTKFPSYLVRHPRKVAWLFHQHREAYDLYGTPVLLVHATRPEDRQVREAIQTMDTAALSASAARSSRSRATWPTGSRATTACPARRSIPPPHHLGRYRTDGYGDYLFYAGRLDRLKRLDLAIDAMKRVRSGARLKIAGAGPLRGGAAQADRGPGRRGPRGAAGLRLRRRARRPLRALPRRLLRAAQRGLRLRDGGGVPLAASRWSPPPTRAGRSSS